MDVPRGIVITLDRSMNSALVEVDARVVCERCAAGRGCGAGIFGASENARRIEARVAPGLSLEEGDAVSLELAPRNLLRAAAIVYGLPLIGAGVGAAVAYAAGFGDAAAAALALAGLAAGLLLARRRLRGCLTEFVPTVSGRVDTATQSA